MGRDPQWWYTRNFGGMYILPYQSTAEISKAKYKSGEIGLEALFCFSFSEKIFFIFTMDNQAAEEVDEGKIVYDWSPASGKKQNFYYKGAAMNREQVE